MSSLVVARRKADDGIVRYAHFDPAVFSRGFDPDVVRPFLVVNKFYGQPPVGEGNVKVFFFAVKVIDMDKFVLRCDDRHLPVLHVDDDLGDRALCGIGFFRKRIGGTAVSAKSSAPASASNAAVSFFMVLSPSGHS